jgi:hypothetical protein
VTRCIRSSSRRTLDQLSPVPGHKRPGGETGTRRSSPPAAPERRGRHGPHGRSCGSPWLSEPRSLTVGDCARVVGTTPSKPSRFLRRSRARTCLHKTIEFPMVSSNETQVVCLCPTRSDLTQSCPFGRCVTVFRRPPSQPSGRHSVTLCSLSSRFRGLAEFQGRDIIVGCDVGSAPPDGSGR